MNLEELKTVLTDIVSNLEMVLQGLQAGAAPEEPTEALMESLEKAQSLLSKEDKMDEEEKTKKAESDIEASEPGDKPPASEEDAIISDADVKTMKGLLAALQKSQDKGENKVVKEMGSRIEVLEKAISEMIDGFNVFPKEEQPTQVQKGVQTSADRAALLGALTELLTKGQTASDERPVMGSGVLHADERPIYKNRHKIAETFIKANGGKL